MTDDLHCFDKARFGVIRLDVQGRIEYANEWCSRVLGLRSPSGVQMSELIADESSMIVFQRELKERQAGRSGDYSLRLKTRGGRGKDIRVQVLGTPVIDSDRTVRGAIGILQNLEFDDVIAELRGLGEAATDAPTLFGRLTDALARIFEFDALVVSLYEEDGRYARVFFRWCEGDQGQPQTMAWDRPWIRLTDAQRSWVMNTTGEQRAIGCLAEFLENPLWQSMRDEPATHHFLELGINSIVGTLVKEGGQIVASLSLMHKRRDLYSEAEVTELDSLPLDKCILAVLHNIRRHEMEFHLNLLQQLLKRSTVKDMANYLVDAIGREYKLSHVSLFRVDWATTRAQLQAQWCDQSGRRLPAHYQQSIDEGIIGSVVRTGKPLYIEDVSTDSRYVRGALDDKVMSGSEFSWPVFYDEADHRVAWVFNIEDQHVDSLSPREQRGLAHLAVEVGGLLQRMNDLAFLKATFASTSDPVVVIDSNGEIKKVNPAATRLFAVPPPGHLTGNITTYLQDAHAAASFLRHDAAEVETMLKVGSATVPVLFSSCSMPDSLGGKVVLIKDMRPVRRMEELTYLGEVSKEVALQAQTPLALAATWIDRLRRSIQAATIRTPDQAEALIGLPEMAERVSMQLRRIQHAMTRLALYDQPSAFCSQRRIPISLSAELESVLAHLPLEDRKRITFDGNGKNAEIRGNPVHCAFVLETCIAFLLRHLPDDKKVSVVLGGSDSTAEIEFRGYDASNHWDSTSARERFATQLSDKLGLAESTLQSIMQSFDGSFERHEEADGLTVLKVRAHIASSSSPRV